VVLKNYQTTLLDAFGDFLSRTRELGNPATSFHESTLAHAGFASPYNPFPSETSTPYVCLRVPTGGGKTLIGGHAIREVQSKFLNSNFLLTLWLVPSDPIREQTLKALRTPGALLHDSLRDSLGAFEVLDIDEALSVQPGTLNAGHTIIVSTIQSFKQGSEESLRVYRQNGDLMNHFAGRGEGGAFDCSLASVIQSRRPFIIVDEAHSQGSPLALSTLGRLAPSCVLELTATPDRTNQPSNVLRSVSASTLQSEDMLKLPLRLATNPDWRTALSASIAQLRDLEKHAAAETTLTGERIEPVVMLIQAERRSSAKETMTPEVVRRHLIEDYQIPERNIAIATGALDELTGRNLGDLDYPQFILTVDKLREGWDCPNAYVLFSFRNTTSATAVEQVLGRVLRMPHALRKRSEALNQSYAFVVSDSLAETAAGLRDGMVHSGFERYDANRMLSWGGDAELDLGEEVVIELPEDAFGTVSVPNPESFSTLPAALRERIEISAENGTMSVAGFITPDVAAEIARVFGAETRTKVLQRLVAKLADPAASTIQTPSELGEIATFPLLGFEQHGTLDIFDETSLLDAEWVIRDFEYELTIDEFGDDPGFMRRMTLSMSDLERIQIQSFDKLDSQLAFFEEELGWDSVTLVSWLDRQIVFPYTERSQKIAWINAAVTHLLDTRGLKIAELGYRKFRLRGALERKLAAGLHVAEQQILDAFIADSAASFHVRDEFAVRLENGRYAFDSPYVGSTKLNKHFFPDIGNLKSTGEEFECAQILANESEDVVWWVRNVERKQHAFWLQLASARFYPDFLAKLSDGTLLAIEYKGAHLAATKESQEKRRIGELWAERSEGACRFLWIENKSWAALRKGLQLTV
jgi:type III restriction enzyme